MVWYMVCVYIYRNDMIPLIIFTSIARTIKIDNHTKITITNSIQYKNQ